MSTIKIFIASSGELSGERNEMVLILNTINKSYPDLKLEPIKWETDIPSGSYDKKRIQDEINPLLNKSEIVILLIYSKLGKFTFEEYELAKTKNKKIFIYFKTGFSPDNKEEIADYNKVIEFKDKIETENQLLFEKFANIDQFRNKVTNDLNLHLSKRKPEKPHATPKHLTPVPAYNQENLIGRKGLLEKIHQKLASDKEVVLVNGVVGIGKTTIAFAYVNDEAYTKHYNHIAWVTVMDNIKDALVNQLSNDDTGFTYNSKEDVDANLKRLCDVMRHFEGDNLLVIDNANDPDDILNNKTAIESFEWKTLFTSRSKPADTTIIPVEELRSEEAKELFCRFYKREIDDELLTKLLELIEHHTLLTELLAKAANRNKRLDIAALYDMVKEEGINATRLDGKIPIGKHADQRDQRDIKKEQKLYNYIIAIFDLDNLNEDEKVYLRYFSVLPPVTIDARVLFDFFQIKEENETTFFDTLDELVKKGWLQEIEDSFKAHPLIQTVARECLKPDARNCTVLINSFALKLKVEAGDNPLERKDFIPYAESIFSFIDEDDKDVATLANNLATILKALGNYEKALEYGLKALGIYEEIFSKDHPYLATSYNNISITFQYLGDLEEDLKYGLKALGILEKTLSKDHPNLATSYNNISITYRKLGDFKKALEFGLKALDIDERTLSKDHPSLATSYSNISITYQKSGDLKKALEYGHKALDICEKEFSKDHPDLAGFYNNISYIYYDLNDYVQAKEYIDKAVDIYQRVLPAEHPNLKSALEGQEKIRLKIDN